MEDKPVRRRRRNPGGGAASDQSPANPAPRRRRRRAQRGPDFRTAALRRAQGLAQRMFGWFAALWLLLLDAARMLRGIAQRLLPLWRRRKRPFRRGRQRGVRSAALLAACGFVLLALGGRGIWRFVSDTRANRATEEDVQRLYVPVPSMAVSASPAATPEPAAAAQLPEGETPSPEPVFFALGGAIRPELSALAQANGDLVGWLHIPDVIDQPVLYRNNVYYETHDFYGRESTAGAIFLDYIHPLTATLQNVLLHGHNMKDGAMFGRLLRYYRDADFLREHGIVHFDTLYEEGVYAVFAVLVASFDRQSEHYFDAFSYGTYRGDEEFEAYIAAIQARSLYDVPIEIGAQDAILTLSTCLGEDRLVVLARRLHAGETEEEMRAQLAGARKK